MKDLNGKIVGTN